MGVGGEVVSKRRDVVWAAKRGQGWQHLGLLVLLLLVVILLSW